MLTKMALMLLCCSLLICYINHSVFISHLLFFKLYKVCKSGFYKQIRTELQEVSIHCENLPMQYTDIFCALKLKIFL